MSYLKHILQKFGLSQKAKEQHKPPPNKLELVYDAHDIKAYKFKNPLHLPYCRYAMLSQALNDSQLNVTKDHLVEYLQKTINALNQGNIADASTLVTTLQFYVSQHTANNTLQAIANALIILDGEPVDKIDPVWIEKKQSLFKSNLDFRGFFLKWAYLYLMTFSSQSVEHLKVEDYLQTPIMKEAERLFMRLLTENTAKDTSAIKT